MEDEYRGYKYRIELNTVSILGNYYCGYVDIPKGHKYHGLDYDEIPVDCHGGLTYGSFEDGIYVIGFDCAHYMDSIDVQNEEYCEEECKSIIDQLIEAN